MKLCTYDTLHGIRGRLYNIYLHLHRLSVLDIVQMLTQIPRLISNVGVKPFQVNVQVQVLLVALEMDTHMHMCALPKYIILVPATFTCSSTCQPTS